MKNNNFIITESEETRNILIKNGLIQISSMNSKFVFINDKKKLATFQYNDLNLVFTDLMTF